jgi:CelD/BcsL family acetyltransferase involved in cellulose biosynthesis
MITCKSLINGFEVEITHSYNIEKLQRQWLNIQEEQSLPFFLTWAWISCWLDTYSPDLIVITASHNNTIVAIGLFTRVTRIRHGVVMSHQYLLHQMGDPLLDQIWMEYNDFICIDEYRVPAVNACIQALQQSEYDCDEIILSMITASRASDIQHAIEGSHILLSNPCYSNNLDEIRAIDSHYLATLNSNTRYQIRRSMRLYQQLHGEIRYRFAENVDEALAFFHEAGEYHVLRWKDSGFNNKQFVLFHENLIKKSAKSNSVDFMKITSGDTTIAILYFHLVGRAVYFYLQGINYEANKKLKPGLVAHALATQYYLNKGMRKYDYMGGYSQYKRQLSNPVEDLVTLCIQKPSLFFSIENMGRKLKHLLSSITRQGGW